MATLLPILAVTVVPIVFDADFLLLPALGGGAAACTCANPLLLSWAVWTAGGSVIEALTSFAPILANDCLPCEALCINTWLHSGPRLVRVSCSLLPKVLVIHHPTWPLVALAGLCNDCLVGHQLWHSRRVLGRQYCHIDGETLNPCG